MLDLKPGDVVTIYHDPMSQTDSEGDAVLLERYNLPVAPSSRDAADCELWQVCFEDDVEGLTVKRWICPTKERTNDARATG